MAKGTSYVPCNSLTGAGGDSLRWISTSSYSTYSPSPRATLVEVGLWVTLSFPYALLIEVGISLGPVVVPTTFPYDSLVEVWILAIDLQGKGSYMIPQSLPFYH